MREMKNILITGATGGLGLALTHSFCQAGYVVTATGRSTRHHDTLQSLGAVFTRADLTNPSCLSALCQGKDTIVHAAALSDSWGSPADFRDINLTATENLLTAAKNAGCGGFVYISSPSVYAEMRDRKGLTEASPVAARPLNHYARTKLLAEQCVLSQDANGFATVALRPRAIVGPDDKVLLPKILKLVKSGKLPVFRRGQAKVEPTDVRDAANATLLAAQNLENLHGKAVNISGGKSISVRELAEKIAQATSCSPRFVEIPMPVASIMAWFMEWYGAIRGYRKEPKLTRYALATLAYSQTFDMTLAREKLGYTPAHDAICTMIECAARGAHEAL